MLQFITHATEKYSIIDEVKMVLQGGCKWIQLRMKDASADEVTEVAKEVQPLCKENECILVIDDWVEIAKELHLDGVHLGKSDMNPKEAREILGQQFIIGTTANTFEDIEALSRLDIDYIGLGPFRFTTTKQKLSPVIGVDGYRNIMTRMAENGIKTPAVAIGGITYEDISSLMETGLNGIAVSGGIINADSPVMETEKIISLLKEIIDERNKK